MDDRLSSMRMLPVIQFSFVVYILIPGVSVGYIVLSVIEITISSVEESIHKPYRVFWPSLKTII